LSPVAFTNALISIYLVQQNNNVVFRLGEKVAKVDSSKDGVVLELVSGRRVQGDAVLYAVGRQGSSDSLNLAAAGVQVEAKSRGLLKVNPVTFQTNVKHIYAAGDIIGFPALASTSMEQGTMLV
jgi:NAD(P) transhydrogenase